MPVANTLKQFITEEIVLPLRERSPALYLHVVLLQERLCFCLLMERMFRWPNLPIFFVG
jgi:hypothetical protein